MRAPSILAFVLIVMAFLPSVYGDLRVLGEYPGLSPTAIAAVDLDKNGVPHAAVVGTSSWAQAYGSQNWNLKVGNAEGVVPVDMDRGGLLKDVVVAGNDIVGVDSLGRERWRERVKGYSAAAGDFRGDGYVDEVVVGSWTKVYAIDATRGGIIWEADLPPGIWGAAHIAIVGNRIIVGADHAIFALDFKGTRLWDQGVAGKIMAMAPMDLEKSGVMDGVALAYYDGKDNIIHLDAIDASGKRVDWRFEQRHDGDPVSLFAVDPDGDGKLSTVVVNVKTGVFWLDNRGRPAGSVNVPGATGLAPVDLDGDGILDDVLVGKDGNVGGQFYVVNSRGQVLAQMNQTGATEIVALDLNGDGRLNDAVAASYLTGRVYLLSMELSDNVTSSPLPTLAPVSPLLVSAGPDMAVLEGTALALTANATPSNGANIVSYLWTEGKKILGNSQNLHLRFDEVGIRTLNLTVVDSTGASATDTVLIAVFPSSGSIKLPFVDAGPDLEAAPDSNTTLTARAIPSENGSIVSYLWFEGDKLLGTDQALTRAFGGGVHKVTVKVVDSAGRSATAAVTITVAAAGDSFHIEGLRETVLDNLRWALLLGIIILVIVFIRERVLGYIWERQRDWLD